MATTAKTNVSELPLGSRRAMRRDASTRRASEQAKESACSRFSLTGARPRGPSGYVRPRPPSYVVPPMRLIDVAVIIASMARAPEFLR